MVFPAVNVRPDSVVIDERFAPFRHSAQRGIHGAQRRIHLREQGFQALCVALIGGIETGAQGGHCRTGFSLDFHVNQDEPLLVNPAEKVLDQSEVAAFDLARRIETEVVVERVAAVAEDRRPAQALGNVVPGRCEHGRQDQRGPRSSPDVGVSQITQEEHGSLAFARVVDRRNREGRKVRDRAANTIRYEELWQTQSQFFPIVESLGKTP